MSLTFVLFFVSRDSEAKEELLVLAAVVRVLGLGEPGSAQVLLSSGAPVAAMAVAVALPAQEGVVPGRVVVLLVAAASVVAVGGVPGALR